MPLGDGGGIRRLRAMSLVWSHARILETVEAERGRAAVNVTDSD